MQGMRLIVAMLAGLLALGCGVALATQSESNESSRDFTLSASPTADSGVELESRRTETSQTFRLPDGKLETRIFESPIHYRDDESDWEPIGQVLKETDGATITNGANDFDVSLPKQIDSEAVRLSVGDQWVASKLIGPDAGAAQLEGQTAIYEGTHADVSYDFSGLANGLKEDIVIADASQPSTFTFDLTASAGVAPTLVDGAIEFRGEDGKVVAILPAPTMADSAQDPPQVSNAVHYELGAPKQGHWPLTVDANRDWLTQPERKWPVRIDPTIVTVSPTLDCTISGWKGINGWGGCGSAGAQLLEARYLPSTTAPDSWRRSLLKFSVGAIPTKAYVSSAKVGLYSAGPAGFTSGVELRRVTRKWTNEVNWASAGPDKWTSEGGDYSSAGTEILTSSRGNQAGWWNFSDSPLALNGITSIVQDWVSKGGGDEVNFGFLVKLIDDQKRECGPTSCVQRWADFSSSATPNPSLRPYLQVTYSEPAPTSSKITSPTDGTETGRWLKLKSSWTGSGMTGVTYQYRKGSTGSFVNIPAEAVKTAKNSSMSWPQSVQGNESAALYLDTLALDSELKEKGGPIQVRALFDGSGNINGYSMPVSAKVDPNIGGTRDATSQVGPGSLDLVTGNYTATRTDVSIPYLGSALEFARTSSSRKAEGSGDTGILGRGWTPSIAMEAAGGSEWRSIREVSATTQESEEGLSDYALLTDLEGYEYAFEEAGGAYLAPPEAAGWVLVRQGPTMFVLSDPSGSATTFESGPSGEYLPVSIAIAGDSLNSAKMVYKYINGAMRLEKAVGISPTGRNCTLSNATMTVGCRALEFNYEPASKWGAPASFKDRLASITYYGPSSATTMASWEMARYEYDSAGRLIAEWDPRITPALKEKYGYAGGVSTYKGGQLQTVTPPGQEPWTIEYGALVGEAADCGRVKGISRPSLLPAPNSIAKTTIVYRVPTSGGAAPIDMSAAAVEKWGQQVVPFDATAVFRPDDVPASSPSSYARASIFYTDGEGQIVNTVTPSGAGSSGPVISTTEADQFGNVVRELSPQNRLRALVAGAKSAERAAELQTKRVYSADGTEMLEEWGPTHETRLESGSSVQARSHVTVQYDEGWPPPPKPGGPNPPPGVKPRLPTKETVGARVVGQAVDVDIQTTKTEYDWMLRKPADAYVDPSGLNLHTSVEPSDFGPQAVRMPGAPSSGEDAHTTYIEYYSAEPKPGFCNNKPGYAGLPCESYPASQPGIPGQPDLLVTKVLSYSPMGRPTEVVESPGGGASNTRTTIIAYDGVDRPTSIKRVGGGTALPPSATVYNNETGMPVEQKFTCESGCEGFDSQATVVAYDKLGRPVQYTDADANTSKTTYDLLGRPATVYDGRATQVFNYDATSGLLTKLEDPAAGTFTAAYDADGSMIERGLPNGLVAKTTYDEVGAPIKLAYTKVTSCTEKCTWLEESNERSIYGQILTQKSLASSQEYSYDKVGRLTLVKDTPQSGGCTTRQYFFDADSNRTKLTTRTPGAGGVCDTSSTGASQSYSYDAADRLTGEVSYDDFGRITSLPSKHAGGSTLATSFYNNEMVLSQSQGGITNSYQLDAALRPRVRTQTGGPGGTEFFHYSMASDSTAWSYNASSSTWSRNVSGIGGELAAIEESSGAVSLQLANLHGDVVATASLSQTAKGPTANFEFDEFGNPRKGTAGRFGWLGGETRRTELASGVIQMGVRSYVPAMGRFISSDPVVGGSANTYDYANADPVNSFDLTGEKAKKGLAKARVARGNATVASSGGGESAPQATASVSKQARKPVKTRPIHAAGGCTVSAPFGVAFAFGGTLTIAGTATFSCKENVFVLGFLAAPSHAGPIGESNWQDHGVINLAIKIRIGEPLQYCIVVATGHSSSRYCGPAIFV